MAIMATNIGPSLQVSLGGDVIQQLSSIIFGNSEARPTDEELVGMGLS